MARKRTCHVTKDWPIYLFLGLRRPQNRDHPLINVLIIAILCVICGADTFTEIERFGLAKEEWLKQFLALENGVPSHNTFGRVFHWLDESAFQDAFLNWTHSLCQVSTGEIIAFDGKKLRGRRYLFTQNTESHFGYSIDFESSQSYRL